MKKNQTIKKSYYVDERKPNFVTNLIINAIIQNQRISYVTKRETHKGIHA